MINLSRFIDTNFTKTSTSTLAVFVAEKLNIKSVLFQILTLFAKGPVKLVQWVKIPNSFLQSVSNLFHFIILSLLM